MKRIYNEELQKTYYEPDCVEEWIELIYEIGYDCDRYETVDDFKTLIGDLLEMVLRAGKCLRDGDIYSDGD